MPLRKKDFYSYEGAQKAAQALIIKSQKDYNERYQQDPRLPSNPQKLYYGTGWNGWHDFLEYNSFPFYASFSEAKAAAQTLGVKRWKDYQAHYRKDPRLVASPQRLYSGAGWTNWYDFLGKEKPNLYPTYSEAKVAIQALGIDSQKKYLANYRKDSRLPACPHQVYAGAGWTDWYEFFGNNNISLYSTYTEAQKAAKSLGIRSGRDYKKRFRQDSRLPSTPQKYYAGAGWADWYEFLGNEKRDLYSSYFEAQAAAQGLSIKNTNDYRARYSQDPRLPLHPYISYGKSGWAGWHQFLGKEKRDLYVDYAEAQAAAVALGIKRRKDYKARYLLDPRLPASPECSYANAGWADWYQFLKIEKKPCYESYAEAKDSAIALGIRRRDEYRERYQEDPKLPSTPQNIYADAGWVDWYEFLGNEKREIYPSYFEARAAAQALGIKSLKAYKAQYWKDSRLPSCPQKYYADSGWTDAYDFLGTVKPIDIFPYYPKVWSDIEKWLDNETNIGFKIGAMKLFLIGYFRPQGLPDDSRHLLWRENSFNAEAYQRFIESQAESRKKAVHGAIAAFFKWALREYCTDVDAEESIVLPGFRNPFETVLAGYSDSLPGYRPSQSTKIPLGYEYILRSRQYLVPDGEKVLINQTTLKDLPHLQKLFRSRADWMEVDESNLDFEDSNCIWRVSEKTFRDGNGDRQKVDVFQIWSPARFVALYTLLRFPLRGQQIVWLDSGEADREIAILDAESGAIRWNINTGYLAGQGSKKRRPQAAVQHDGEGSPKLFVTTNKTGRTDGGYDVEWIPDDLIYWFILLREWQSKYNPLTEPTAWLSIDSEFKVNKKILKARGTQCFLFRTSSSGQPLSPKSAFEKTLPELLYLVQKKGEKLAMKDPYLKGQRYISPYTPHSLRVSLITAYVADGSAPIHLISKLVGHSSLVMTIYYTKLNSTQMRRAMSEAEKRAAMTVTERHAETIRTQGLHPLRRHLIATSGNRSLIESDVPNSACIIFDWGICPMSAASCHIGGEALVERPTEVIHGPVESGYLGQKNCLRCRFFVTGVPFLGGLIALANELALEIHTESGRFQNYSEEVFRLEEDHYDACHENRPDTKNSQRKQAIANEQQSGAKLDGLLGDYVAINHYVQCCLKLIKEYGPKDGSEDDIRLIANCDLQEISVSIEESTTQYHLLAEICQNAAIYKSANPSRALPLIAQAIDRMAENNNMAPAMFRLNDEQKLFVANELTQLLLQRLRSWERIEDLFSGGLMLLDIDAHEPKLTRISTEIQNILLSGSARQLTREIIKHD